MAATLTQAEFTYTSGSSTERYMYTIVQNAAGRVAVRDIQNPYGFILSPYAQIPQSVADDIAASMLQVEAILSATSAINGTLAFSNEVSKVVTFPAPLGSTSYRVQLSPSEFVPLRISAKSTTSFTVQAAAAFTGTVGFDVFV